MGRLRTGTGECDTSIGSALISTYCCVGVAIISVMLSSQFAHWFLLPVLLCGIVIGVDAVEWIRGRMGLFSPIGIIAALGIHFFFLAPLLHVYWDAWMRYVDPPSDWRDWLGGMAILNLFGLIAYRLGRRLGQPQECSNCLGAGWRLDRRRFGGVMALAMLVCGVLQILVYASTGGVQGYIEEFSENDSTAFQGMGWIFLMSDSFPILSMMAFAVYARNKKFASSTYALLAAMLVFFVLELVFGGLRGSRSNTIWGLFWAMGLLHLWVRPVSRGLVLVGCLFLVIFMYFYGFYKTAGLDGLTAAHDSDRREQLTQASGRSLQATLLQDLGRSDMQAYLLFRLHGEGSDYVYSLGRTYLGTAAMLVPRTVWPDRPATKVQEGTDAQYGMYSYVPQSWVSSRVYGLAGEVMLNFGPYAVPFAFLVFGVFVGRLQRFSESLHPDDVRLTFVPYLANLGLVMLVSDSDNVLWFLLSGALPLATIRFSSRATTEFVPEPDPDPTRRRPRPMPQLAADSGSQSGRQPYTRLSDSE